MQVENLICSVAMRFRLAPWAINVQTQVGSSDPFVLVNVCSICKRRTSKGVNLCVNAAVHTVKLIGIGLISKKVAICNRCRKLQQGNIC